MGSWRPRFSAARRARPSAVATWKARPAVWTVVIRPAARNTFACWLTAGCVTWSSRAASTVEHPLRVARSSAARVRPRSCPRPSWSRRPAEGVTQSSERRIGWTRTGDSSASASVVGAGQQKNEDWSRSPRPAGATAGGPGSPPPALVEPSNAGPQTQQQFLGAAVPQALHPSGPVGVDVRAHLVPVRYERLRLTSVERLAEPSQRPAHRTAANTHRGHCSRECRRTLIFMPHPGI